MQYITGIEAYDNAEKTAVTLGKFDGLHRGHQKLVDKIKEYEKQHVADMVNAAKGKKTIHFK